ncbi:MAG: hypothetical protein IK024_13805 [Treponema sp.]|nr:hypothetical protein [Treponema sp.]
MRKSVILCLLFFILCFSIINCSNNSDISTGASESSKVTKDNFPKLQIVNKGQITILKVVLEGYEFSDLNVKQNQSIILDLDNGMPGGYKDVQVSIRYRPYKVTNSAIPPILTKLDFADGTITTLTINSNIF